MASEFHTLVVGGGVAGLELATSLGRLTTRNHQMRVTLLDADSAHIWKPMLHTIAAGTRDVHQQLVAYAAQAHSCGFTYQPGSMCGVDRSLRQIRISPLTSPDGQVLLAGRSLSYDALVIAVGSHANSFDTPGVSRFARRIDTRRQAESFNRDVRNKLLLCLAEKRELRISIVGGGATGVELAAELVRLTELLADYAGAGITSKVKVSLFESGKRLLAAFPKEVADAAQSKLAQLGVAVHTGSRVAEVNELGLKLVDGRSITGDLTVWAAGIKAPDFLLGLDGLETAANQQLLATRTLQSTLDSRIFVIGDCASIRDASGAPLPPTAQVAHQQATHLARHLPRWIAGKPLPPFVHKDMDSLVSLGRYGAYGSLGRLGIFPRKTIHGWAARAAHALLYRAHQSRLHGLRKGSLLWLVDRINRHVRPSIRLD